MTVDCNMRKLRSFILAAIVTFATTTAWLLPIACGASHAALTTPSKRLRRMLSANTVSKCLRDDHACSMNPAYLLTLPQPTTHGGRILVVLASAAVNCSSLSATACGKQQPCTWAKAAGSCSMSVPDIVNIASRALVCPASQASHQLSCSTAGDSQQECNREPGCSWGAAGCVVVAVATKTPAEQQQWLIDWTYMDEQVWGSCNGTALLAEVLESCHHVSEAACQSDLSCEWAASGKHLGCSARPVAALQAIAGIDAFGSALSAALQLCSQQALDQDCSSVGQIELPAPTLDEALQQEFAYLLQPSTSDVELPSHASSLSLETVRVLEYVGVAGNTSEAHCLPVSSQGMFAYTDCLQLRVTIAEQADAGGNSWQLQLVPSVDKSELNCPCVFMLSGSLGPTGTNASVRYQPNPGMASANEADAFIAAHASLAKICSAGLAQDGVGQSVLITYEAGKHRVDTKAVEGAHFTLTVQGSYVLMTDTTGCALQFKVKERGTPYLLAQASSAPTPALTPPPAQPTTSAESKLSSVQLLSYQGLRKGMEESCLPVNSHGFSPYTSCMHFHVRSLPASSGPRQLQLDPDQGLSQYMCPCFLRLNGTFTDNTEAKAEVVWSEMDWSASWDVKAYVAGSPDTFDTCLASTRDGSIALTFQAGGTYQVNVPTGPGAKVVLERQGDKVLMQDQRGCILDFLVLQENSQEPPAPETLGPSALAAVEELNYIGLLSGDAATCLPVNADKYCPLEDCLSWVVTVTGWQVQLSPKKGLSEYGCPCLLSMAGTLDTSGGAEASVTFQEWSWNASSWDPTTYMGNYSDKLSICNVSQVLQPGQTSPLAVEYIDSGNGTVTVGSAAVRYKVVRTSYSATITDAVSGCSMLYDVKDQRGLQTIVVGQDEYLPDYLPAPPPSTDTPTGWSYDDSYHPFDTSVNADDPWPSDAAPAGTPEPETHVFKNVVRVEFRDVVLGSKSQCLPSNVLGYSPMEDCYSMDVTVNSTHIDMRPHFSVSEFGCPCLFRLVGPITQDGDVQVAQVAYQEMVWGSDWDVAGYVTRNLDQNEELPAICSASLNQDPQSQRLNFTFLGQSPYYQASISQPLSGWQYELHREGSLLTLRDRSLCKLALLVSVESTDSTGAPAGPTMPPGSGRANAATSTSPSNSNDHRQARTSGVAVAAIVVPCVVLGLAGLVAIAAVAVRVFRRHQADGYDALESAELADLQGMNIRDKFAFLVPTRQR